MNHLFSWTVSSAPVLYPSLCCHSSKYGSLTRSTGSHVKVYKNRDSRGEPALLHAYFNNTPQVCRAPTQVWEFSVGNSGFFSLLRKNEANEFNTWDNFRFLFFLQIKPLASLVLTLGFLEVTFYAGRILFRASFPGDTEPVLSTVHCKQNLTIPPTQSASVFSVESSQPPLHALFRPRVF